MPPAHRQTAHKSSAQKREHQTTKDSSHILHSLFELEKEAPGTCLYSCIHYSFTVCNHFVCLSFTNCIKELNSLCCTHASAKQCTKTLTVSPPLSNTTSFLSNGGHSRSSIRNLRSEEKKKKFYRSRLSFRLSSHKSKVSVYETEQTLCFRSAQRVLG